MRRFLAWVALGALLVGGCGDDGGDDGGEELEIDAPAGWQEVPIPSLGFGLAIPGDWEAVRFDERGLRVLEQANPDVPGFATSAHAAYQNGAVFYAAGIDDQDEDQVNDLKIFADTSGEVDDLKGLEDYAQAMITGSGLDNATVTPVDDAPEPTVDVRYQATGSVQETEDGSQEEGADEEDSEVSEPEGDTSADEDGEDDRIVVEGVQRFVLAPAGAVYVFVVTGEDAATVDDLAARLLGTVTLVS